MNIKERLLNGTPLVMDGAMGTLIQQKMGGYRGAYELLNIERPEIIEEIHRSYVLAGADILETNSFGGNGIKLREYGLEKRCEELNERAALVARKAAGKDVLVAGSVAPTGALVEPLGETSAEEVYQAYLSQMKGLERGGVDLIAIETMHDIQEAKLALLAARDATKLPVICSMTFEAAGRTMTGSDPVSAFATLAAYGADMVGANCSMGPDGLLALFKSRWDEIAALGIPLSVWSNAGLPQFIDGKSVYALTPADFAKISSEFARLGFRVIGGCCGTTPEHIRALKEEVCRISTPDKKFTPRFSYITSRSASVNLDAHKGLLRIGERLNPTARKKFAEELRTGTQAFLREEARKQVAEGADILDINVGVPDIDEIDAMARSVNALSGIVSAPLMIDSDNSRVLERALMAYPGVAIVNSISGKTKSLDTVLPILKRFGCFVVALCMDESGIHREADKRIAIGENLIRTLESNGISRERVFIDPLMLAESAEPGSAVETLAVIRHFAQKGIRTSLGLSNISFGLPARKHVNGAYLWMAMQEGLTAAIINPGAMDLLEPKGVEADLAREFLLGKDPGASAYIAHVAGKEEKTSASNITSGQPKDIIERIFAMVVEGNTDNIDEAVQEALTLHKPDVIMNNGLLRGLERVGELYSTGEYFLPQMIASASAMKKGFAILKPMLSTGAGRRLGIVVIGTVRGDVHDIGKNIVAMMLENHGFEVHDLGKDVPSEEFIKKAEQTGADLIFLSSLLTTTMGEMKTITGMVRSAGLKAHIVVGGAVVTREYADSIGAGYGKDAVEGVAVAKNLMGIA